MHYRTIFLLLFLVLFTIHQSVFAEISNRVDLTEAEKAYIQGRGAVTMCVDPDWVPFEHVDEHGNFTGIAADLLELVSERVGISIDLVITENWEETLRFSKSGKCDVIPFLNQTAERDEWLNFTEPLFMDTNVLITREEHPFITNPGELIDKTIVLPAGTSMEEFIRRDYPNLKVMITESEMEAYTMVANREADMTLRSLIIAAYTIKKEGLFNLKINGSIPEYKNNLRIGVLKSDPMLRDILNKGVKTITPQDREQIVNKHVYIVVEDHFSYFYLLRILVVLSIFIIGVLYWSYRLKKLNEERRILLDTIQTQVWYMTDERTYGAVNKAHANFLGLKVKDIAFKKITDHFPCEMAERFCLSNKEVFRSGKQSYSEEWLPSNSGKLHLLSIRKTPKLRHNGTVEYIVCSAEDITLRKQMEDALNDSTIRYDQLAESSRSVAWEVDPKGCYTYVSFVSEKVYGYKPEELVGKEYFYSLCPKQDREEMKEFGLKIMENSEVLLAFENRMETKDKRIVWVVSTGLPLVDDSGEVIGYRGVDIDITEQKHAEEALLKANTFLETLLDTIPNPVFYTDKYENYTGCNRAFSEFMGRDNTTLLGKNMDQIFTWVEKKVNNKIKTPQLLNVVKKIVEGEIRHSDGLTSNVIISRASLLDQEGNIDSVVGVISDISDQKKEEEAIKLAYFQAQIKPHFIYNALNTIAYFCETKPQIASQLIMDLSVYMRRSFEFNEYNSLGSEMELIKAYVSIEKARFGERLSVEYDTDKDVEGLLIPPLLIQPLVENAIRHGVMRKIVGGVVTIRVRRFEETYLIEVIDNGIGMSIDVVNSLNRENDRLENNSIIKSSDSGVGINNINQRLIKLYREGLKIESAPNEGTKVSFFIPRK